MYLAREQTISCVNISFRVLFPSSSAWPRYIRRCRPGSGWVTTAVEILFLSSPIVVDVGIEEKMSLLASEEGDNMTRLISLFSIVKPFYAYFYKSSLRPAHKKVFIQV